MYKFLPGVRAPTELAELASPYPKPGWTQGFGFYEWQKIEPAWHYAEIVAWFFEACSARLQKVSWNDPCQEDANRKSGSTRWRSGHLINLDKLKSQSRMGVLKDAQVMCCMELEENASLPWTDWVVFSAFVQNYGSYFPTREGFYGVCAERGWLDIAHQIALARRVGESFGPCYGIVYYRPHHYGPYQYVYGGAQFQPKKMTEDEFGHFLVEGGKPWSRWNIQDRAFPAAEGYFRDIYPMSFLPEAHLKAPIDGTTFEAWQQRSGIGTLTEILPGFAAWEVPREHEEEAREVLKRNNRLLQYIDKTR